jgi:hypothetical protein
LAGRPLTPNKSTGLSFHSFSASGTRPSEAPPSAISGEAGPMPDLDPELLETAQQGAPTKGLIPEFAVRQDPDGEWRGSHTCGSTLESPNLHTFGLAASGHRIACTHHAAMLSPRRSGVKR